MTKAKPKRPRSYQDGGLYVDLSGGNNFPIQVTTCDLITLESAAVLRDWLSAAIEYLEAKEDDKA